MMPADPLTAALEDLRRADDRIARLAATGRGAPEGTAARARAVLDAIETRNRIAAAVLDAIALEDQALNARMAAAVISAADAPRLADHLIRRDRSIEALARMVETRSREFAALARILEAATDRRKS